MKKNNMNMLLSAVILLQSLLLIAGTATAVKDSLSPSIAENSTSSTVLPRDGVSSNISSGGYITEIDIFPILNQTQNWQGFYGNVSGEIALKDSNNKMIYNWSINMTNTTIYATTESNFVNWTDLYNVNLTKLDDLWFDNKVMPDTIAYTYRYQTGTNRTFVNTSLDAYNLRTTKGFNDYVVQSVSGDAQDRKQVLWGAVVEDGLTNYMNGTSDYELLVPVRNHNSINGNTYEAGNVTGEIYYFYMEIP
jgi:hypothetical protein